MQIEQLLQDYSIPIAPDGHKHRRPGWVNVQCPFHIATHAGYHLGFTLDGKMAYCWSCGIHFVDQSIAKLLQIPLPKAKAMIIEYAGMPSISTKEMTRQIRIKGHKLPSNISPLLPSHKVYLERRNFNPIKLAKEWNLVSTGPTSFLDKVDYSHRILAPIFWEGREVTFQARDVTDRHAKKYLACMKERELIHHKHIVYRHKEEKRREGICVEGITDVWRFGRASFATLGIEYTRQQIRLIASLYDRVGVCFDGNEPTAKRQADELVSELLIRKVDAFRIDIDGDPGGMDQKEADYLVKQIIH